MNKFIIGILSVGAIAFASTPVNARPSHVDNAQIIHQESVITGDHNSSYNNAKQRHLNVNRNTRGNSANGQATSQKCDTFGNGNVCANSASQNNQQINQTSHPRHNRRINRHPHH